MKRVRMEISDALKKARSGSFVLSYRYDGVLLDTVEGQDVEAIVRDPACFEARCFSDTMEILFVAMDGEKAAFLLEDEGETDACEGGSLKIIAGDSKCCTENKTYINDNSDLKKEAYVDREYELAKKYRAHADRIRVREYMEPDEDGQMNIVATRLVALGKGV